MCMYNIMVFQNSGWIVFFGDFSSIACGDMYPCLQSVWFGECIPNGQSCMGQAAATGFPYTTVKKVTSYTCLLA